ncbi:MAG: molybdenum cofactor guanylyltransferase [Chloroflexi bacterium HGW-Chloroflexi-8]|jgi:molybdopterin-guanine dinucleotide biosynthesis protein A|nr:MAG: molybdenum cofactor guanylyltransferase [Chloroflexi bacterium HGW-Chloroflexi-8]
MDNSKPPSLNNQNLFQSDLTIAIQAGGKSTRMGSNKAKVTFLGQPLILRILERVQHLAGQVMILSNNNDLEYDVLAGIPIHADLMSGIGPLAGLYTSLKLARTPYVALVACDMPFASTQLIQYELEVIKTLDCDVVIPETENGLEPMHALYRRETCLPNIEAAIANNERRLISWFPGMKIETISTAVLRKIDPQLRMFLNINTPEDLESAERLAKNEQVGL